MYTYIPVNPLQQRNSIQQSLPASFRQRLAAYVLDSIILSFITGTLQVFLNPILFLVAVFILCCLYFIGFQMKHGGTPGKVLLGLKVVHMDRETNLGASHFIIREFIGKFVSSLFLMIGYLMSLINKERRCLHDFFANTQVVVHDPDRSESANQYTLWASVVTGSILIFSVSLGYYSLFYTATPLKLIAKQLRSEGWEIANIKGSFKKGYSIGYIIKKDPAYDLEIKNIFFQIKYNKKSTHQSEAITLEKFYISSGHIKIKSDFNKKSDFLTKNKVGKNPSPQDALGLFINSKTGPKGLQKKPIEIIFKLIDIANLKIVQETSTQKTIPFLPIEIKRFFVSNLKLKNNSVFVENFYADTNVVSLNVQSADIQGEYIKMQKPLHMVIKQQYFDKHINKDIPLKLSYDGKWSDPLKSIIRVQSGSVLKAEFVSGKMDFKISQFNPNDWLKTKMPLSAIDLQGSSYLHTQQVIKGDIRGSFLLRNQKFNFYPQHSVQEFYIQGFKSYSVKKNDIYVAFFTPSFQKNFLVLTRNTQSENTADTVAQLYFDKDFLQLSAEEKSAVEADLFYFIDPTVSFRSPASSGQ